jgi:ABC-type Mn2+/Zn2+ transport system permease subunit
MNTAKNAHMKTSTIIKLFSVLGFPVLLVMALKKIGDLKMIGILLVISLVIACPLCILAWKYRSSLFTKRMPVIAALTVPVALFLWKWLDSVSVISEMILAFAVFIFLTFIAFFFEEEYLKW